MIAYPFEGRLAHQTLGMLLTRRLERFGARPLGFVATDYVLGVWALGDMGRMFKAGKPSLGELFDEDMLGDDLDAWLAGSWMLKRTFRACAQISGLIEKRYPGQEKSGRQVTVSADLIYDVLRSHEPDHILLQATRADAASGLLDVRRLADMLSRIRGRIMHKDLDRISPLAVPIMLEVGRERVDGEAGDSLLSEAEDLIEEAMGKPKGRLEGSEAEPIFLAGEAHAAQIAVAGEPALCDRRGALYFPALGLLCVSDLHLEKGSSLARRGALIPPYDTAATLLRLQAVIDHYRPKIVRQPRRQLSRFGRRVAPARRHPRRSLRDDGRPRLVLGRRQPRSASAGRPARRYSRGARRRRPGVPARAVGQGIGRARSPAIFTLAPASCSAAARCAAAASPPTARASSCRPSAPIPARSTCSTAPMPDCSGATGSWPT